MLYDTLMYDLNCIYEYMHIYQQVLHHNISTGISSNNEPEVMDTSDNKPDSSDSIEQIAQR